MFCSAFFFSLFKFTPFLSANLMNLSIFFFLKNLEGPKKCTNIPFLRKSYIKCHFFLNDFEKFLEKKKKTNKTSVTSGSCPNTRLT